MPGGETQFAVRQTSSNEACSLQSQGLFFRRAPRSLPEKDGRLHVKKRLTLLFTSVFALWLSMSVFTQKGSSQEEAKEALAQVNAEKAISGRWTGTIMGKSTSTLTVRRRDGVMRIIHYDSSTQWTSQEHHSKQVNTIDASQVDSNDRVICLGVYDEKGEFHAAMISKRLSKP
jgi:hypothetical protein